MNKIINFPDHVNVCPKCGSAWVRILGAERDNGFKTSQRCRCWSCSLEWENQFERVSIKIGDQVYKKED